MWSIQSKVLAPPGASGSKRIGLHPPDRRPPMNPKTFLPAVLAVAALAIPASAAAEKQMPHPQGPDHQRPGIHWRGRTRRDPQERGQGLGLVQEEGLRRVRVLLRQSVRQDRDRRDLPRSRGQEAPGGLRQHLRLLRAQGFEEAPIQPGPRQVQDEGGHRSGKQACPSGKDAYPEAKKTDKPLVNFEIKGKHNTMRFGFDRFDGHNLITHVILSPRR